MFSRLFTKQENYPDWMATYLADHFKHEPSQSIWSPGYVVLDCETTGMAKRDQIVTIGAVLVQGRSISLNHVLDIKLPMIENSKAATVHGELAGHAEGADIQQVLQNVIGFLSHHVVVGHHISFDISKLHQLFQLYFPGFKLKNQVLDTMTLVKRIDPVRYERSVAGSEKMQLEVLCQEFGILVENRHTALGDAFLTAQLFQKLLVKLEARGIQNMGNLMKTPGPGRY